MARRSLIVTARRRGDRGEERRQAEGTLVPYSVSCSPRRLGQEGVEVQKPILEVAKRGGGAFQIAGSPHGLEIRRRPLDAGSSEVAQRTVDAVGDPEERLGIAGLEGRPKCRDPDRSSSAKVAANSSSSSRSPPTLPSRASTSRRGSRSVMRSRRPRQRLTMSSSEAGGGSGSCSPHCPPPRAPGPRPFAIDGCRVEATPRLRG